MAAHHRKLETEDFERMGLPPEHWNSRLSLVPESIRSEISKYCECGSIHSLMSNGSGFFLCGPEGIGKTGAAAVLAKMARCHYYPTYFVTIADLRELIRNKIPFDDDISVFERCRTVPFLVLDGLRAEDAEANYPNGEINATALGRLMESRVLWKRVTIVTATLAPVELTELFPMMTQVAAAKNKVLSVTGPNLRVPA